MEFLSLYWLQRIHVVFTSAFYNCLHYFVNALHGKEGIKEIQMSECKMLLMNVFYHKKACSNWGSELLPHSPHCFTCQPFILLKIGGLVHRLVKNTCVCNWKGDLKRKQCKQGLFKFVLYFMIIGILQWMFKYVLTIICINVPISAHCTEVLIMYNYI